MKGKMLCVLIEKIGFFCFGCVFCVGVVFSLRVFLCLWYWALLLLVF